MEHFYNGTLIESGDDTSYNTIHLKTNSHGNLKIKYKLSGGGIKIKIINKIFMWNQNKF